MIRRLLAVEALILVLCICGCATPVGVRPSSEKAVYRQLTGNALSGQRPSGYSNQLLERLSLGDRFRKDPKGALADLHAGLAGPDDHDRLFALAELSFLHANRTRDPQYFLAAAIYAYVFLFPEDHSADLPPYDPRLRLAMDIYNRAVANGLRASKGGGIDLSPRRLALPFGHIDLSADPAEFRYAGYDLTGFVSLQDFGVRGFRNQYREPGIGAPLSARVKTVAGRASSVWIAPQVKVPVTVFVRFERPRRELKSGLMAGRIEVYDADAVPAVRVEGRPVPLESAPSAALAYRLNNSPLWDFEIAGFRRGDFRLFGERSEGGLYFLTPYRPGRIPVVFVHGTASSPARWAEMGNELLSDPSIASRYQFWFFIYNSGNPIALSAMHLREGLQAAVNDLDPKGNDPAMRNMVVIGHSQGGLLTKMTAVSSGTRFWDAASRDSFDSAKLSPATRDLLRRSILIEPLPFVRRVVFIATPHHGSYMAENLAGKIGRRFVNLPAMLSKTGVELVKLNPVGAARTAWRIPTAIDNMDSANPFLRTLSSLPLAPGVTAHSIIPVKGKGPVEKGKDGVVRYTSAHMEGVESELVVRTGHSCQSDPHTIEEVRRILYEHARVSAGALARSVAMPLSPEPVRTGRPGDVVTAPDAPSSSNLLGLTEDDTERALVKRARNSPTSP